jgi:hypothetical protein
MVLTINPIWGERKKYECERQMETLRGIFDACLLAFDENVGGKSE